MIVRSRSMVSLILLLCVLVVATGSVHAQEPAPSRPVKGWSPHLDGGGAIVVTPVADAPADIADAVRLTYLGDPPGWANTGRSIEIDPRAVAIVFHARKVSAGPEGQLHLLVVEPDGDMWVTNLFEPGLKKLGESWQRVETPLMRFNFWPRGDKTRSIIGPRTLLIGCTRDKVEVEVGGVQVMVAKDVPKPKPKPQPVVKRGEAGAVAILRCEVPHAPGHSSPITLAGYLEKAGFGVTFVDADQLADEGLLTSANFDSVVLPYGDYFPSAAANPFVKYLKAGGTFLATGGYAFDSVSASVEKELTATDLDAGRTATGGLNARFGKAGDALRIEPNQIPVFDPTFPLERVAYAATDLRQNMVAAGFMLDAPLGGLAAVAMTGSNSAVFPVPYGRYVPILRTFDRLGRPRGPAGAIVFLYDGPYKGSAWAFFGVTTHDIFASDVPLADEFFANTVRALIRRVFLKRVRTPFEAYRPGEVVPYTVEVCNFGKKPFEGGRRCSVGSSPGTGGGFVTTISIAPGQTLENPGTFASSKIPSGTLVNVSAEIWLGEKFGDELHDSMTTGVYIVDDGELNAGPRIGFADNYFTWNGRPLFFTGTNQTGMVWASPREDPLLWRHDVRRMRDLGLSCVRFLHFSPFADKGYEGQGQVRMDKLRSSPSERFVRETDALVSIAAEKGVGVFFTPHDWMPVELSAKDLESQRIWNRFWANRYRDVDGIFFDIQNEPAIRARGPVAKELFNEYLRERYDTVEALRAAWGKSPPEGDFGRIEAKAGTDEWGDLRTLDFNLFRIELLNRWIRENAAGLREGKPGAPVTVGWLHTVWPADKLLGMKHLDFANTHYYGSIEGFRRMLKFLDRRFEGKGISVGEFGARRVHDACTHGRIGAFADEGVETYLETVHYTFGMGGAFACNWDWKDMDDCIFPWGLVYRQTDVPKDWALAFRNSALLLRFVRPKYVQPELALLVPDSLRLGVRRDGQPMAAINRAIEGLLATHVDFCVVNEFDLARLPAGCKALVWPMPYCPRDEDFERVLDFVKSGGALYLSGDVAYDFQRKRTRLERLAQLRLSDPGPHTPFDFPQSDRGGRVQSADVGKGRVFFVPYPLEAAEDPATIDLYRQFLETAGVEPVRIEPDDPNVHVFRISTTDGGAAFTLLAAGPGPKKRAALSFAGREVAVEVSRGRPAFVLFAPNGKVTACESAGDIDIAGARFVTSTTHFMAIALDGKSLEGTDACAIMPTDAGRIALATEGGDEYAAQLGTFSGGKWRALEEVPLAQMEAGIELPVDEARKLGIVILYRVTDAESEGPPPGAINRLENEFYLR